jgi:hypothetical protein
VISAIIKDLKRFEKKRELARISRKYYAMGPEEKLPEEPGTRGKSARRQGLRGRERSVTRVIAAIADFW